MTSARPTPKRKRAKSAASNVGEDTRPAPQRIPRGYGAMRQVALDLDPRIDLTRPIYRQAQNMERADRTAAE